MAGHSKWANIKHRKASQDKKKAGIFTKLAKDITIAARSGGDPLMNFSLKMVLDKAKSFNMPKDNIERAIKKGTGEDKSGAVIETEVYEAYGVNNVAFLIKTATDNKNRTVSQLRSLLKKNGGKLAEAGSVAWQFDEVGQIVISVSKEKVDELELALLETSAKDYEMIENECFVYTQKEELAKTREELRKKNFEIKEATLIFKPQNKIEADKQTLEAYERLLEELDDHDDVMEIYDNFG